MKSVYRKWLSLKKRSRRYLRNLLMYITNHIIFSPLAYPVRRYWYRNVIGVKLGRESSILSGVRISEVGNIEIGEYSIINNDCCLDNRGKIIIGSHVSVSYGVLILTAGYYINDPKFGVYILDVLIEDYVWICSRCIINPGVKVRRGAVVLPGSVVTKDVEEFTVVGGAPAKKIRERSKIIDHEITWDPFMPMLG